MRLLYSLALFLICGSTWAQTNPFYLQPLGQVKEFLQLSDSQLRTILTNNDEYNRWSSEKQSRIERVQSEIAGETARDPLDPNALGVRYAEIETICREMKDQANQFRTRNLAALSADQKTKLKVLEDAVKLAPVIAEAQFGNLIGGSTSAPYTFTSTSIGIGGGSVIGGIIGPLGGCYMPFPGNILPASRFTGAMPAAKNAGALRWFDTTKFVAPENGNHLK